MEEMITEVLLMSTEVSRMFKKVISCIWRCSLCLWRCPLCLWRHPSCLCRCSLCLWRYPSCLWRCLSCFRFVGTFMTRRERIDLMGDRAKKFTNVYVKNFQEILDETKLRELFETCGAVNSCKVRGRREGAVEGYTKRRR